MAVSVRQRHAHTKRDRDADRNLEGKRDSMSVHADGDRSVWSYRAAES